MFFIRQSGEPQNKAKSMIIFLDHRSIADDLPEEIGGFSVRDVHRMRCT